MVKLKCMVESLNSQSGGALQKVKATVAIAVSLIATSSFGRDRHLVDAFYCANVSNDVARLECYDLAYSDYREAIAAPGEWFIQAEINPLNDSVTTLIGLNAYEGKHPIYGPYQLVIRCHGNKLSAWVAWKKYLGETPPLVTSRIGSDQAQSREWHKSISGSSTFYPDNPVVFVRRLMEADRFVAQIAPDTGDEETAIFNIKGLDEAAEPIKEACLSSRWTPTELELIERAVEHESFR